MAMAMAWCATGCCREGRGRGLATIAVRLLVGWAVGCWSSAGWRRSPSQITPLPGPSCSAVRSSGRVGCASTSQTTTAMASISCCTAFCRRILALSRGGWTSRSGHVRAGSARVPGTLGGAAPPAAEDVAVGRRRGRAHRRAGAVPGRLHTVRAGAWRGGLVGGRGGSQGALGLRAGSIRTPVLLYHGRQDRFVPYATGEWLAGQIPGVQAELTDDDGHLTLPKHHLARDPRLAARTPALIVGMSRTVASTTTHPGIIHAKKLPG